MAIGERIRFIRNLRGMTQKTGLVRLWGFLKRPLIFAWLSTSLAPELPKMIW